MRPSLTREVSLFFGLFLVSFALVLFDRIGFLQVAKSGVAYLSDPIEIGLYSFRGTVADQLGFLLRIRGLVYENRELAQKLSQSQAEVERLKQVELENEALKKQFQAFNPQLFKLLPAKKVGLNRNLVINQGERAGVKIGQTVVFGNNLIGKVVSVTPNIAKVRLPSDPDSKISGIIYSGGQAKGIVVGNFGSGMSFDKVLQDSEVSQGQSVLTEGDEGMYPNGLVIGQVAKVEKKDVQLFQTIELSPPIAYEYLDNVFVILE